MPVFELKSPSGKTYSITAPEGATVEQAYEYLKQAQPELFPAAPAAPAAPVGEGMPARTTPAPVGEGMPALRTQKDPYAIGSAAAMGATFGAATPEITALIGKGLQVIPTPLTKGIGLGLEKGAPFMKTFTGRAVPAVAGFFGGGGEELLTQELEMSGYTPIQARSMASIAGVLTPLVGSASYIGAKNLSKIANVDQAVSGALREMGVPIDRLSSAETKTLANEIAKLRGGSPDVADKLYAELESGAGRIVKEADAATLARRNKAASDYTAQITAAGKIPTEADKLVGTARGRVYDIGNADVELTDIGTRQRGAISQQFDEEKLLRDKDYQALKTQRDADVAARENTGDYISKMPEYKKLAADLDKVLLEGKVPTGVRIAPETEQSTLSAFREIKTALSPRSTPLADAQEAQALAAQGVSVRQVGDQFFRVYEPSFNAIDTVRRKLGDAAFGQGEEGFKALGQARAKDLYGRLSELQSKYAGQAQDELQGGYELASGLLERFKGGAGAKVLKTERLSPDMYTKDPKDVPAAFFKSRDGVAQLSAITKDPALIEETARDYVARNLKGKTADEAEKWLKTNSDFLSAPELKTVKQKVDDYTTQLRGVEEQSAGMLATAKGKEAAAKQALDFGMTEASGISEAGQKTAKNILGSKFGQGRVNALLASDDKSEWIDVASALKTSPDGRAMLAQSLERNLADIAERSPKTDAALDALDKITEPLIKSGLANADYIESLRNHLLKVKQPDKDKLNWLSTQVARGVITAAGGMLGGYYGANDTSNMLAPPNQNNLAGQ
jgi:hypothetical protein